MTNDKIFARFEDFIDDAPDRELEVELAESAKSELEAELQMEITKKVDTSLTSTVGGTYLTAYSLAGIDWFELRDYIYVGTTRRKRVSFERRLEYKDDSTKFYVDVANNRLYLCGTVTSAETISIPYIYNTPAIGDNTSEVIVWPSRFHILIPMHMAIMWPSIEGGDKSYSFAPEWMAFYNRKKSQLIDWDARQKLAAIGGETPYGGDTLGDNPYQINI